MGLRANRGGAPVAPQRKSVEAVQEVQQDALPNDMNVPNEQTQHQAPPTQPQYQAPPTQPQYQAPPAQSAPATYAPPQAPARPSGPRNEIAEVNAGIIDNIDDMQLGGNYVTVDGNDFLYKDSNTAVANIDAIIHYGKRFYQYFDEATETYHNSDVQTDKRYKLKCEIRWNEWAEGAEMPTEYIMTLSTTSALQFFAYLKQLSKESIAVNQVWTRMTTSRQVSKDGKNRYTRVEFENAGAVEYDEAQ